MIFMICIGNLSTQDIPYRCFLNYLIYFCIFVIHVHNLCHYFFFFSIQFFFILMRSEIVQLNQLKNFKKIGMSEDLKIAINKKIQNMALQFFSFWCTCGHGTV